MNAIFALLAQFAGPIGNLINSAIVAGTAGFITYAVSKGMDLSMATLVATSVVGILAAAIQFGAGLIGVKIKVINDGANGIKVVPDTNPAPAVDAPLK